MKFGELPKVECSGEGCDNKITENLFTPVFLRSSYCRSCQLSGKEEKEGKIPLWGYFFLIIVGTLFFIPSNNSYMRFKFKVTCAFFVIYVIYYLIKKFIIKR
ncbi:MAG: hypothetical protein ACJAT2_003481 [Bacteriovoracaceae bacterium]|jgi:hypothetical protein